MTDWKKVSEKDWQERLTPEQFEVTRKAGTERPFTGEFWDQSEEGTYLCICCNTELFKSDMKFDAGCGWPSFFTEVENANIQQREDLSLGRRRVEILCGTCDAHLGHIFPDGPDPTGNRYCVNSASLSFTNRAPLKPGDKIKLGD